MTRKPKTRSTERTFRGKKYAVLSGSFSNKKLAKRSSKEMRKAGWQAHVKKGNDERFYVYRRDPEAPKNKAGLFSGQKKPGRKRK